MQERVYANFVDILRFTEIFSCKHFALLKLQSSLSTVVQTSFIAAVNESVETIINNVGPGEEERLVVLSLMNQTHQSIDY